MPHRSPDHLLAPVQPRSMRLPSLRSLVAPRRRLLRRVAPVAVAAGVLLAADGHGVAGGQGAPAVPIAYAAAQDAGDGQARAVVPWGPGERLEYEVRFGKLRVGNGHVEVRGLETIRGREAYHTYFQVRGGIIGFRVKDVLESWIDTRTLASLRFVKDQEEGGKDRETRYEIFPERTTFREGNGEEERSVAQPLDDGSFLFLVRTLPLRTGDVYELTRYFKPDRNPVRIRVLRRERITVPAGTFDAVVVQPTFRSKGLFSENGKAEVWFSDDASRHLLQMKSSLPVGSLNLYLRTRRTGTPLATR